MTPGDRIKTDRRDARKLASLYRADQLTAVHPPTPEEEAVRDLVRCREDAKADLLRTRNRLGKLLLRHGLVYTQGKTWTLRYRAWLRALEWTHFADQEVVGEYRLSFEHQEARIRRLEERVEEPAVRNRTPSRSPG